MTEKDRPKGTRGYSRAFPAGPGRRQYLLDRIPDPLWRAVKDKAARQGVSIRSVLLTALTRFTASP